MCIWNGQERVCRQPALAQHFTSAEMGNIHEISVKPTSILMKLSIGLNDLTFLHHDLTFLHHNLTFLHHYF